MADTVDRLAGYPAASRPFPDGEDFARAAALPRVQMFVIGRSGSGLIHAFLDGHPEVLHIPHTFKFYDFVAGNDDLHGAVSDVWIDRLVESEALAFLFDSSKSVILGGRLGPGMGVTVKVDTGAFRDAFLAATGHRPLTATEAFVGIVLAYGWAIGQDLQRVKVLFHHVHHGDWLWPDRLIDRSNCQPAPLRPPHAVLRADRYVVSVCHPDQALNSIVRFVAQLGLDPDSEVETRELLIRLLAQDWSRAMRARDEGADVYAIRLEDLRSDPAGTMSRCAAWLGIDAAAPTLRKLTYYGFEWFGDIYTSPSSTVKSAGPTVLPPWQDRAYLSTLLGRLPVLLGYGLGTWPLAKVVSAVWPSPRLFSRGGWNGYGGAIRRTRQRRVFARQFLAATEAV